MRRRTQIIAATAMLTAAGITWPQAYTLKGSKWPTRQVPYYVNPSNGDVSADAAEAAVRQGADVWSLQSSADFSFYYMGRTSNATLSNNGRNEVFFRNTSNGSLAAETYWWKDSSNRIVDADIIFYDGTYPFFTGTSGCSGGVYIEEFAAHEFGHVLGLGHSDVSSATMWPIGKYCSSAWRTLDPDDVAGVEALYPPSNTNTAPTVTVTSPASNTSVLPGTTLTFSGSANDREDGSLSTAISWTSSVDGYMGSGPNVAWTPSAGNHIVTASVTDSKGYTASQKVSVAVSVPNTTPSVSISAPTNNSNVAAGATVSFSGSATDPEEGNITARLVWASNLDGPIGMGGSFSKALSSGTHNVSATVTDGGGATASRNVTVIVAGNAGSPSSLWLTVQGYKIKGSQTANLSWSGASSVTVDIYRNGVRVTATANDGEFTDKVNKKGNGTQTYMVCESGTSNCSNSVVASF